MDSSVCQFAAQHDRFCALLYLLCNGCPPSDNIWKFTGNNFSTILYVFEEVGHTAEATPLAMNYVVKNGNLDVVKIMREKGFPWTDDTCVETAFVGAVDILEYAHTHGAGGLHKVCAELMGFWGHFGVYTATQVACFQYAHQHSHCALDVDFAVQAARDGELELLTYLYQQGCTGGAKAPEKAAKYNRVECLEYLLLQGCPRSKRICAAAIDYGQGKCLEMAKKYGCV